MNSPSETNGTALAVLSDKQIQQRIKLNQAAGWGLEKATQAQLNMVFLVCQKFQLLPGDDVTLFEGKPWVTIDGRVKLMRRHPEYRGYSCRPLSKDDKEAWGYDADDIVVECIIRTTTWGEISARGKVTAAEAAGTRVEGRRHNAVAHVHPVEMAEKRAIARAERAAFGADAVLDEDEARIVVEERVQPEVVQARSERFAEIFGTEEELDHPRGEVKGGGAHDTGIPGSDVTEPRMEKPSPTSGALSDHAELWQQYAELLRQARECGITSDVVRPLKKDAPDEIVRKAISALEAAIDAALDPAAQTAEAVP